MERNLLKIRWKISVVTSDLLIKQQMPLNLFHFWETGTTIFSSGRLRGIFLFGPKTSEGQGGTKSVQKNLCNGYDHGGDGGGDDDHHCWLRTPPCAILSAGNMLVGHDDDADDDDLDDDCDHQCWCLKCILH